MEAKFVQGTPLMIDYTPGSAVAAGEVLVVNGNIRIAHSAIAAGVLGAVSAGFGVYDGVKDGTAAVEFADGANVYWNASSNLFTATSSDTWAGVAIGASSATDTLVRFVSVPTSVTAGNFTASGTAGISGNTTIGGTLTVDGASTLTGNVAAGGTLAVTGATTLSSTTTLGGVLTRKHIVTPVAAAGSSISDAAALGAADIVHITSDGAAKGVKLPAVAAAGRVVYVINNSSTAAELYAEATGTVNGLSADASVVVPASKGLMCISTAAKTWIVFDMAAKATAS